MKNRELSVVMVALMLLVFSVENTVAGVLAEKTRIIFRQQDREQSLMLVNTNPYPVMVQTWIDDGRGTPDYVDPPFMVTPAIFRLEPGQIQGIRLIYNQHPLPVKQESVWWLNLYEVPPQSRHVNPAARLMMTMNTQIKVFYRPDTLSGGSCEVNPAGFSTGKDAHGSYIEYHNTTPCHISFTTLALTSKNTSLNVLPELDMMTYPFNKKRYYLPVTAETAHYQMLTWHYLPDNGVEASGRRPLDQ